MRAEMHGRDCAQRPATAGLPGIPHFAPKAKRVIYLFQSGGPSQLDLFDYKPQLDEAARPGSAGFRAPGQRLTGMTLDQTTLPDCAFDLQVRSARQIGRLGQRTAAAHGENRRRLVLHQVDAHGAINHDPAITFLSDRLPDWRDGRALGSWIAYGLGSENKDLPAFVVMISQGGGPSDQPLYDRLWGSGFLPTQLSGREVPHRSAIRCCTCPIPRDSAAKPGAGFSTIWRS